MERKTVIVIGAVNMDICGRPDSAPNMRDSNPGRVTHTPGGVGRNIAHDLCLLGLNVRFIAAIGDDVYGDSIYRSCSELGMDMSLCRRVPGGSTSTYLYITDEKGEMQLAVCDTDIAGSITPEYLSSLLPTINAADAVVVEGNLSEATLDWIAGNVTAPLYADPVSITKAQRMKKLIPRLTAFKPNELEAMSLTGETDPVSAAKALAKTGAKRVFVTVGAEGIITAEGENVSQRKPEKLTVVNTTGCGDAATAAIVWAGVHGLSVEKAARCAMTAAGLVLQCPETVSDALCGEIFMKDGADLWN